MRWMLILALPAFLVTPAFALKGAEPALSDFYKANVFIVSEDVEGGGSLEPASAYCNATLLAPQWMVTAAHCVQGLFVLKKNSLNVQIGEYKYRQNKEGKVVRIGYVQAAVSLNPQVEVFFLPVVRDSLLRNQFRGSVGVETDIALVHFTEPLPLPADFPYAPVATAAEVQSVLQKPEGRSLVASINPFEEMSMDTKRFGYPRSLSKSSMGQYLTATSGVRVDPGDSGAPLFIHNGQSWKLGGVVKGMAKNIFSEWDVYPLAGQNLCRIAQAAGKGSELFCK